MIFSLASRPNPASLAAGPVCAVCAFVSPTCSTLSAAGLSHAEILAELPDLELDDIKAALEFAAKRVDHPLIAAERRSGSTTFGACAGTLDRSIFRHPAHSRSNDLLQSHSRR
jgi:uncharacterized protein DUF433